MDEFSSSTDESNIQKSDAMTDTDFSRIVTNANCDINVLTHDNGRGFNSMDSVSDGDDGSGLISMDSKDSDRSLSDSSELRNDNDVAENLTYNKINEKKYPCLLSALKNKKLSFSVRQILNLYDC